MSVQKLNSAAIRKALAAAARIVKGGFCPPVYVRLSEEGLYVMATDRYLVVEKTIRYMFVRSTYDGGQPPLDYNDNQQSEDDGWIDAEDILRWLPAVKKGDIEVRWSVKGLLLEDVLIPWSTGDSLKHAKGLTPEKLTRFFDIPAVEEVTYPLSLDQTKLGTCLRWAEGTLLKIDYFPAGSSLGIRGATPEGSRFVLMCMKSRA